MQNVDDIRSNVREIITVSPSSLSLMHTFIFICLFTILGYNQLQDDTMTVDLWIVCQADVQQCLSE